MNILLVNDDGYFAEGITNLAALLVSIGHKVFVVAPDRCCSGIGHAANFKKPIKVKAIDGLGYTCFSVSGTPADCVLVGLHILKEKSLDADLVISGVNDGLNLGTDISYSGTVNAAIEASIVKNVLAIAVSADIKQKQDYLDSCQFFVDNLDYYLKLVKERVPISINIQSGNDKFNGHKFCHMGERKYNDFYSVAEDSDGHIFTLDGAPSLSTVDKESDVYNFAEGFNTITPLKLDFTNHIVLKNWKLTFGES